MKIPKIAISMSDLDEDLIKDADQPKTIPAPKARPKWGPVAACLVVLLLAGYGLGLWLIPEKTPVPPSSQELSDRYKNVTVSQESAAIVWPWNYKTVSEQYTSLTYEGRDYSNRGRSINAALVGDPLGALEARGWDIYEDREHVRSFEVYSIRGISRVYLLAVKMENTYYVFDAHQATDPTTLGELIVAYDLTHTLPLTRFSIEDTANQEQCYTLPSDEALWEIISECRDAELIEDNSFFHHHKQSISFTVTSEALGTYKNVLQITQDGYLWTNVFDYAKIFFIGEEAAEKIHAYAVARGSRAAAEPFATTLPGVITEVGEDYFLMDDSIACLDPAQGRVYRISLNSLSISRCIDFVGIGVGDTVLLYYEGEISTSNEISGAYHMQRCRIYGGNQVLLPD